jgi:hypothetical protein
MTVRGFAVNVPRAAAGWRISAPAELLAHRAICRRRSAAGPDYVGNRNVPANERGPVLALLSNFIEMALDIAVEYTSSKRREIVRGQKRLDRVDPPRC